MPPFKAKKSGMLETKTLSENAATIPKNPGQFFFHWNLPGTFPRTHLKALDCLNSPLCLEKVLTTWLVFQPR